MKKPIVIAEHITKYYPRHPQLMRKREKLSRYLSHIFTKQEMNERFLAIDNVSFNIYPGETIGIVGNNGAGKSTLLRVITGITKPSSGIVTINGDYRELFALNAGFIMELSGRKNIYLYAAMKNISEIEIDRRIDEIIDFSELGNFIDEPVKTYSNGMRSRLGFSLITHTAPDILFIDEALSAGDTGFREKCNRLLKNFQRQNKTFVIVSHNLVTLKELCTRIIWLEQGQVHMDGQVDDILGEYQTYVQEKRKQKESRRGETKQERIYRSVI